MDINDYEQAGGMWYLPHFTTAQAKFHVVYDDAALFNGTLINDYILPGPDMLTSFFNVLSWSHVDEYAITTDLQECFFEVGIP